MPNDLSNNTKAKILSITARLKTLQFPNISRFIPEKLIFPHPTFYPKLFITSFISGLLFLGIIFQTLLLIQNRQKLQQIALERQQIQQEITYWQGITQKYHGYRDVYLKLASLEYKLGNTQQARQNIDKAFTIDPNTKEGKVLGDKINH